MRPTPTNPSIPPATSSLLANRGYKETVVHTEAQKQSPSTEDFCCSVSLCTTVSSVTFVHLMKIEATEYDASRSVILSNVSEGATRAHVRSSCRYSTRCAHRGRVPAVVNASHRLRRRVVRPQRHLHQRRGTDSLRALHVLSSPHRGRTYFWRACPGGTIGRSDLRRRRAV